MDISIIEKLNQSVDSLEYSIHTAAKSIVSKYGEDHTASKRLQQYSSAINSQRSYIENLNQAVQNNNLDETYRLIQIINGISTLIKDDARALVECLYNNSCEIDKDVLN